MLNVKVILASYNGERWISEQILSVLNQERVNVSISYFDDASSDQTNIEIQKHLRSNDYYHCNDTRLGTAGKNFLSAVMATDFSDYDYVAFCDQDDIWFPSKLIDSIEFLKLHGFDGVSTQVIAFWDNGKQKTLTQSDILRQYDYYFEGAGQGCTFLLKSHVMSDFSKSLDPNSQLLNSIHYHDWLVYAFCRCKGYKWGFLQSPTMLYRQHSSNDTGSKSSFSGIKKRVNLISNGWYKDQVRLIINYCSSLKSISAQDQMSIEIILGSGLGNYFRKLYLVVFNSRRKMTDRCVLFLFCLIALF